MRSLLQSFWREKEKPPAEEKRDGRLYLAGRITQYVGRHIVPYNKNGKKPPNKNRGLKFTSLL